MLESSPGSMQGIHLLSEGGGRWTDAEEQHIPELDGCVDVDIQWSLLTNSIPINRLSICDGESQTVRVVAISLPDPILDPVVERYQRVDSSRVLLDSPIPGRQSEIIADQNGFLISG